MAFLITKAGRDDLTYSQSRRYPAPTRGVRHEQPNPDHLDHLRALSLVLPPGAAFSHTTAAWLHRLPVDTPMRAHVTVPPGTGRGSRKALIWHQSERIGPVVQVERIPCTDPLRTWLACGSVMPLPELVAVTDVLLRRRLLTDPELVVPAGVRGARLLRRAAQMADPRSLSPRESLIRVELHLAGLPTPEVNLNIIVDGTWIACADLAWPLYRVIVEYDGDHHQDPRQRHQDAQTRNALMDNGWQVRVLTNRHLQHLSRTVQDIADLLVQRGWNQRV